MPTPFAFVQRENRTEGPHFLTAPDSQFQELLPLNVAWQESPEPIHQSPFFAHGRKIKPNARQRITSHLALGAFGNWENVTFHIGKLVAYYKVPTYAGAQLPDVIRANIQPANPTTYGSIYEIPSPLVSMAGPAYTSSGFAGSGNDGDPYS